MLTRVSRLLLRNSTIFERLRTEIDSVVAKEQDITRAHIQRMPYLHNILQESNTPSIYLYIYHLITPIQRSDYTLPFQSTLDSAEKQRPSQ